MGTSRGMEGKGVANICNEIKGGGYKITTVSHDNDASSMAQIQEHFSSAIECLDIGHAAKNVCEKVKFAAKCQDGKELKGYGERIKCWFQKVAYESHGNVVYFETHLLNGISH